MCSNVGRAFRRRNSYRHVVSLAFAAALVVPYFMSAPVLAQTYPAKPVRLVVPYPAGGGSDTVARPLAQKLSENLVKSEIAKYAKVVKDAGMRID